MKPGYKQTEVGVIPEEWEVKTLGSLTTLLTNGFVGTATTAYVESDEGVLYVQGYNVQENGFNFHGIKRVSKAFHARNKKSCLQTGDLLTIQTGDIGVTTVVPPELAGANCHALIISRLNKQDSDPGYYCQYFNSERGRVAFKEIETGTTMKHLNGGDMKRLFLPSPPVEEQRAIAAALSDVDGLPGGLDRLIAKKRDLKQAAMQQLLTGQTRLPGFHGEWEVKRLDEVADVIDPHPSHRAPDEISNGVPFVGIGDLDESGNIVGTKLRCVDRSVLIEHAARYNLNDQLIGLGRVASIGKVVCLKTQPEGYAISPTLGIIRGRTAKRGYLLYALRSKFITEQFTRIMSGSTRSSVGMEVLRKLNVSLPPTPEEQTAIAEVLTDMDAELAALEQRREKTRALKQAMMQELLTGRTRLV